MKKTDYYKLGLDGGNFPSPSHFESEHEFDKAWEEYSDGQNERYNGEKKMNETSFKKRIRKIVEASCGKSRVREMDYDQEDEDPAELARYDALNNNKDEMLYRDNPIYRQAFDDMMMRENKMRLTKRQLKRIVNETRRTLADNPYAFEGDDVGPGEIPANYRSKLYSALAPLGFETGLDPESKYFQYDVLDGLIESEKQLAKAGFKDPSVIVNFLKPRLADMFRAKRGAGASRTQALVDAITYDVFSQAAGGAFAGDPTHSGPSFSRQPIWNEEEDPAPMISDSYNRRNTMKITKKQLKRIIKEEYSKLKKQGLISEGVMSMIHIEIQNAIAEAVDDLTMDPAPHGTTIEDIHMYIDGSNIQFSHGYVPDMEEIEQIVYDMVDAGDLVDDGRGYLMLASDY